MSDSDASPLMRQYLEIKRGYPEAILFFRVGDFYEMFFEDAQEASRLLSIALTSRDKNSPVPVPLCGVPYHAATGYIAKLLKAGRTVALCEQVEDPKLAKGLVRREVVRLYTPGTLVDTEFLSPVESNYLVALACRSASTQGLSIGLAALDVSTGEFWITEFAGPRALSQASDELTRLEPREVLFPSGADRRLMEWLGQMKAARLCERPVASFDHHQAVRMLLRQFRLQTPDALGCQGLSVALGAAGAVLHYFRDTQPTAPLDHIRRLAVRWDNETMHLDSVTIRNLELLKPLAAPDTGQDPRPATLLSVVDRTVTAMGGRLLRQWLVRPLIQSPLIAARLDAVGELKERMQERVALRTALRGVQDIARLGSRLVLGLAGPRELLALKQSLAAMPEILAQLTALRSPLIVETRQSWDDGRDMYDLIEQAIQPEAPLSARDGNVIRDGYDPRVDEWRKASKDGKGWIAGLEHQERARTGIESLKVRYNQVFGYYIEITKANLSRVPLDYIRKQTLVNAERFMTPELKELEERVTGADAKLLALEQELFAAVRERLARESHRLEAMARTLSLIDVLSGLAEVAALHRYTKPAVDESGVIAIRNGRHPVVERLVPDLAFVPNDTELNLGDHRLLILTGPNMAGKSTYLRQVALIVLLAQMGSFVPADEARIGLVDRIFTRVGASDNLAGGHSTFMVEMVETAGILSNATARSLILLDEIGRGTSTYDGLSIAWAVAEHIHDRTQLGARTLFATHYHEMTQLEQQREGIKNYRVAVQERDGDVVFLRKIVPGGADRSYGIHVAQLAGLPPSVISRAQEVLRQLEQSDAAPAGLFPQQATRTTEPLPQPHPIVEEMKQIDLFSMTPLDALNRLAELQRRILPDTRTSTDK
ncbi:DNA mismatch repair protein MutS [Nitrospira moscoviensis]|uniref:DNA mismatch repair protein MutS n=1 Tax=Nitrospira moscoviensis TaxID=42253 RepID=A0A0K2GIR2_NITMO|nr:DNA mismatch repair protein MutS [Nitrospira moscoviensis]ALA60848.1 DNA mismatch repair protein MutS [Nitrospira moscoviensis]